MIAKEYGQYLSLVRIDPDFAKYDWLVQNYQEAQRYNKRTPNLTTSTTGHSTGTKTINLDEDRTVTDGGTDTHAKTGYDLHEQNMTYTDNTTTEDSSNASNPAGKRTTTTHPNRNVKTSVSADNTSHTSQGSQEVALSKDNPMSISYTNGVTGQGQEVGHADWVDTETAGVSSATTPNLDWHTATRQDENNSINNSFTHDISDPTKNYTDLNETYTGTDQVDTQDYGQRDHVVSGTKTSQGENDRATYNSTNTITHGKTQTVSMGVDTSITDGKEDTGSVVQTGTEEGLTQSIFTGRHEAPADILERAKRFIENTNAFDFLYNALNPCFMGFYDV